MNRDAAHRDPADDRLARLLDAPFLARVVPHMPAETLYQLIRSRGLDACSELVALATPTQLTSLLDLDLWRHPRPGLDHQFDVDRFGEWVEVLVDAGSSVAARTVAALDEDLVVAGLFHYVRVFDPGIFEPVAESDDEPIDRDKAMREGDRMHDSAGQGLECELGGYIVRARRGDAWDAIVTLLAALDAEHVRFFHAVMQGCRRLSHSTPEVDGLDDLLPASEQHLYDIAIERDSRRSQLRRIFAIVVETAVGVDAVAVRGSTLERFPRDRCSRIARSGYRAPHRGRRHTRASPGPARRPGGRPGDPKTYTPAEAHGVRARYGRDRLPHAHP